VNLGPGWRSACGFDRKPLLACLRLKDRSWRLADGCWPCRSPYHGKWKAHAYARLTSSALAVVDCAWIADPRGADRNGRVRDEAHDNAFGFAAPSAIADPSGDDTSDRSLGW